MAYQLGWGDNHPGHLVYLIDLSASMNIDNRLAELQDVILKVVKYLVKLNKDDDGDIKEALTLTIIGYNSDVEIIKSNITVKELKEMRDKALKEPNGKLLNVTARWQTYTAKAFDAAAQDIKKWIAQQEKKGIPMPAPIVLHITDGYPYEEELKDKPGEAAKKALFAAERLKNISVPDGNTLLFNIHIEPGKDACRFLFNPPADENQRFLYDASSVLSEDFAARARIALSEFRTEGVNTDEIVGGSRFMVANERNKDILVRLIVFGSTVSSRAHYIELAKPNY